jgi:steroid 5-alpha reductase family enzyme
MSTDPEDFVLASAYELKEKRRNRGDFVDTLWRLPAFALVLALAFFALGVAILVLPIDDDVPAVSSRPPWRVAVIAFAVAIYVVAVAFLRLGDDQDRVFDR